MKLEQQVVSLPIAKRLKELGVKQESLHSWQFIEAHGDYELADDGDSYNFYSAFTVAELDEILPEFIYCMKRDGMSFLCRDYLEHVPGHPYPDQTADTGANARGLMLCYLLENGIIKLEK